MPLLVAMTVTALLIASPGQTEADQIAANGGFLIGSASRCGIATDRVEHVGQLVLDLIAAAAPDTLEREDALVRYARFFVAGALANRSTDKLVASCRLVSKEFARLEQHQMPAAGSNPPSPFKPADGE